MRRLAPRFRRVHHRGHPVLRLRPSGSEGGASYPDYLEARGGPARGIWSQSSGVVDLHAGQIQGFFNIPFDHLYALPVFLEDYLEKTYGPDAVFVSADRRRQSSVPVPTPSAWALRWPSSTSGVSAPMSLRGDVHHRRREESRLHHHRRQLIDTAGTLCNAARAVMAAGARSVVACATHGVLSGPAVERINESPLQQVIVTNSIATVRGRGCRLPARFSSCRLRRSWRRRIRRIHNSDSVSSLFV